MPATKRRVRSDKRATKSKMQKPRRRVSLLPLRALRNNEYRSKLYGLLALREIWKQANIRLLDFRVCNNGREFSINSFKNLQQGRLIIRTDPKRENYSQSMEEWVSMPRLNLYLRNQPPKKSERLVKQWMRATKKKFPNSCFIVHKVRDLRDYKCVVQLNADFNAGEIVISKSTAGTDKFRDENVRSTNLVISDNWKIRRNVGSKIILPEGLQAKTVNALKKLMDYAAETGHRVFEASYVTYKEAPNEPEFYDLIFGKKM